MNTSSTMEKLKASEVFEINPYENEESQAQWNIVYEVPKPKKMTKEEKLQLKLDKLKEKTKKQVKKAKQMPLSQLKKKVQRVVNEYVRERDKNLPCISCGKVKPLTAGHFWTQGAHGFLRYNLDNIQGQCLSCNSFKSGNLNEYRLGLIKRIGVDRVEDLDKKAHATRDYTREELEQIREDIKQKTLALSL